MIAIAISSIIPGWRSRTSATPPARNGQPPHKNTTEPSTGPTHAIAGKSMRVAEPVHHHLAGDDERDRQQQAQPEPAAEHLRVVAGVLVVTGMIAMRIVVHAFTIPPGGILRYPIGGGGYIDSDVMPEALVFNVPEPSARPGDEADFSYLDVPAAGAVRSAGHRRRPGGDPRPRPLADPRPRRRRPGRRAVGAERRRSTRCARRSTRW